MKDYKNTLPIVLFLFFSFFVVFFIFSVVNFLDKDRIELYVDDFVTQKFQDTDFSYENVSVRIGTRAEVRISDLIMETAGQKIIKVNQLRLMIPYYSMIGGDGQLNVILNDVDLNSHLLYGHLKLEELFEIGKNQSQDILSQSRINLRMNNLNLLLPDQNEFLYIEKFLLKNLSTHFKTAFEINSPFTVMFSPFRKLRVQSLIVGEFSLEKLLEDQVFESNFFTRVNHLSTKRNDGSMIIEQSNKSFSGRGSLNLKGTHGMSGSLSLSSGGDGDFSVDYNRDGKKFRLESLNFDFPLLMINELGLGELDSSLLRGVKINVRGDLTLNENLSITPNLIFNLNRPISYQLSDVSLSNQIRGRLEGDTIEANINSDLLGGRALYTVKAEHSFKINNFHYEKLDNVYIAVEIDEIDIDRSRLRGHTLYDAFKQIFDLMDRQSLPLSRIDLITKGLRYKDIPLSLTGSYEVHEDTRRLNVEGEYNRGLLKAFLARDGSDFDITMSTNSFDVDSMKIFFPLDWDDFYGILTSEIELSWKDGSLERSLEGFLNVEKKNGSFPERYHLSADKFDHIKNLVSLDTPIALLNEFELLKINATVSESNLKLIGVDYRDKAVKVSGSGNLSLDNKESEVFLSISSDSFLKGLESDDESFVQIPLRLEGVGFHLKPDILYTIRKMSN